MPLKYQSYGCRFKCGHKHSSNYWLIFRHEEQCWYNPEVKSCITCRHGELVHDSCTSFCGYEITERWEYRTCDVDPDIEFDGIKPQINCINWEEICHAN